VAGVPRGTSTHQALRPQDRREQWLVQHDIYTGVYVDPVSSRIILADYYRARNEHHSPGGRTDPIAVFPAAGEDHGARETRRHTEHLASAERADADVLVTEDRPGARRDDLDTLTKRASSPCSTSNPPPSADPRKKTMLNTSLPRMYGTRG
jgi:hypothetical protein